MAFLGDGRGGHRRAHPRTRDCEGETTALAVRATEQAGLDRVRSRRAAPASRGRFARPVPVGSLMSGACTCRTVAAWSLRWVRAHPMQSRSRGTGDGMRIPGVGLGPPQPRHCDTNRPSIAWTLDHRGLRSATGSLLNRVGPGPPQSAQRDSARSPRSAPGLSANQEPSACRARPRQRARHPRARPFGFAIQVADAVMFLVRPTCPGPAAGPVDAPS